MPVDRIHFTGFSFPNELLKSLTFALMIVLGEIVHHANIFSLHTKVYIRTALYWILTIYIS